MGDYAAVVMKPFEELEFRDDFMFGKTMEDAVLCHDVIECLLQEPIGELKEVQGQKEFRFVSDGKPIRLDVFNIDNEGVVYDAEMQNLNNKSLRSLALPKRSRFYQSAIDIDFLNKGDQYTSLPESKVMFICTFDPFGLEKAWYTFRERCDESPQLILGDGTEKHFYNCTYTGNDLPDDIRELYEYIRTGKTNNSLTKRINEAVEKGRRNEEWRTSYMKERVIIFDAIQEVLADTELERARADAEAARADAAEKQAANLKEQLRELEARLAAANS